MTVLMTKIRGESLVINYDPPPIPIRDWDFSVVTDNYDGAPDAGFQCRGEGREEFDAVFDFYDTHEVFLDDAPCYHRPMYRQDLE